MPIPRAVGVGGICTLMLAVNTLPASTLQYHCPKSTSTGCVVVGRDCGTPSIVTLVNGSECQIVSIYCQYINLSKAYSSTNITTSEGGVVGGTRASEPLDSVLATNNVPCVTAISKYICPEVFVNGSSQVNSMANLFVPVPFRMRFSK